MEPAASSRFSKEHPCYERIRADRVDLENATDQRGAIRSFSPQSGQRHP
jgi:hypothetical protein